MDTVSKTWFAVLNNPEEHGYSGAPQCICEKMRDEWIAGSPTRSGAWAYCISAEGLHHIHMVLEDRVAMRFSKIKANYAVGMHFEPTKGTKQQAEDYIHKRAPYDEKGETVVCIVQSGEIRGATGQRTDLGEIEALLNAGMTPAEIFRTNFSYRRYEHMIKADYYDRRLQETPIVREVSVHYIVGDSGTGKSYKYAELCAEHGESSVYHISDYQAGGFDLYQGEPIIFLDEYKGQYSYSFFLTLIDKYRSQVHARYSNVHMLWSEVYISSIYPPEMLYELMVPTHLRRIDTITQLLRRITDITYCYKDVAGDYRRLTLPMGNYNNYAALRDLAAENNPFT